MATADDYQRHYETEASGHLRAVSGFRGTSLLRREDGTEVLDHVLHQPRRHPRPCRRRFRTGVVEEAEWQALSRWDKRLPHHQVVADLH
jgi:hypothetical protein